MSPWLISDSKYPMVRVSPSSSSMAGSQPRRPVGVEDARHLDLQPVLAVVIEEQRLGAALAFVVAGADADRVHIAPVSLGLRMHLRIAIDLTRRGEQETRARLKVLALREGELSVSLPLGPSMHG